MAWLEIAIFWAHRYPIRNQFFYLKACFLGFILTYFFIMKIVCQLTFPALNKRGSVYDTVKISTDSNQNTTDFYTYTK